MPYGSMLHIPQTNYHILAAKQEPNNNKKARLLTKTTDEFSGAKGRRTGQQAGKKDKTERPKGVVRRTREEIVKWSQTTALSSKTGGRLQTSPASLLPQPKVCMCVCDVPLILYRFQKTSFWGGQRDRIQKTSSCVTAGLARSADLKQLSFFSLF